MKPYYQDGHIRIFNKDCRSMSELSDESVQCVVTSPPYWGLRRYSGLLDLIWGGDKDCEHDFNLKTLPRRNRGNLDIVDPNSKQATNFASAYDAMPSKMCSLCGAWKGAYGLEPTPEMYIEHTIEILREIRRVLRKDGVVFWNIGDSYFGGGFGTSPGGTEDFAQRYPKQASNLGTAEHEDRKLLGSLKKTHRVLKPKDLCLIPFRIAIAAQEDGWWVRSVIIWSKPNPMPESVTDRPTESHEYILMLTKSARYYWDADAVREQYTEPMNRWGGETLKRDTSKTAAYKEMQNIGYSSAFRVGRPMRPDPSGRNIRSVWEFPTQPYPEAHFAVFPEKLPELCIKAATPEVGCCSKCGKPWERITEASLIKNRPSAGDDKRSRGEDRLTQARGHGGWQGNNLLKDVKTLGWQPACKCNADKTPSLVLDPFAGSGTTLWVAKKLGREAVGYELSEEYCQLAVERNRQQVMELIIE